MRAWLEQEKKQKAHEEELEKSEALASVLGASLKSFEEKLEKFTLAMGAGASANAGTGDARLPPQQARHRGEGYDMRCFFLFCDRRALAARRARCCACPWASSRSPPTS